MDKKTVGWRAREGTDLVWLVGSTALLPHHHCKTSVEGKLNYTKLKKGVAGYAEHILPTKRNWNIAGIQG